MKIEFEYEKILAAQRKIFQFLDIKMSKNMTYMTFWVEFLNIKMSTNMTYMTFLLNFGRAAKNFGLFTLKCLKI